MKRAAFVVTCVLSVTAAVPAKTVTTGTLMEEMVDMVNLTRFPDPHYKTVQYSSYDHRSRVPGTADWFANSDGFGREPVPNFEKVLVRPNDEGIGEYLICDERGPGAIVRVWTAAINGTIRMNLDDADRPVYEGPAAEFMMHPYRKFCSAAGVDESLFADTFQQRNACYLPIPFQKRCRIVWKGDLQKIHFYQIQIRRYEPGTKVRTFRAEDLKRYRKTLESTSRILGNLEDWTSQSQLESIAISRRVAPGQTAQLLSLEGPRAIEQLTLNLAAAERDRALRQTILRIHFDDHKWGQVQSPLGDFFGVAPGINPYESVPFSVKPNGDMICRFVMPFAKSCTVTVENRGNQPVAISGSALPMAYAWDPERCLHFQARWRVDHDLVADGRHVQDMPYLVAQGQGVYVGSTTILLNPNPVPTPYGNWWGEGDEKIFVDDDTIPSTFGTGSEDYYNYAWSSPDIFVFPYCGQPRNDGPANRGFVTNNRWHILDALPFKNHLAFYMELYSHERTPGVSYARIGYHYAKAGLRDDHVPLTDEDVRHLELPSNWQPEARMGAAGGAFYQAEQILVKSPQRSDIVQGNLWAGGKLLVWQPQGGEVLELGLDVPETCVYVFHITAALTPQAGQFYATLDDKLIDLGDKENPIDLNVPYRTLLRNFSSWEIELEKGSHTLKIHNAGEKPGANLGLDFVWTQKK
ncbi:MAG: glycoside hydrolase family 172 protein [Planctomycetota bacterium]|jgi:hypothetical protein